LDTPLADVSRNMDDEQLLALKKNGGVIQIVGLASFVKAESKERADDWYRQQGQTGTTDR
jgi:microsomal dipeptidase-like Zn-dependent dipeptidase